MRGIFKGSREIFGSELSLFSSFLSISLPLSLFSSLPLFLYIFLFLRLMQRLAYLPRRIYIGLLLIIWWSLYKLSVLCVFPMGWRKWDIWDASRYREGLSSLFFLARYIGKSLSAVSDLYRILLNRNHSIEWVNLLWRIQQIWIQWVQ